MKKAELLLANFDARIPYVSIKPKNMNSKVIISAKMYDEAADEKVRRLLFSWRNDTIKSILKRCQKQNCRS